MLHVFGITFTHLEVGRLTAIKAPVDRETRLTLSEAERRNFIGWRHECSEK